MGQKNFFDIDDIDNMTEVRQKKLHTADTEIRKAVRELYQITANDDVHKVLLMDKINEV